MSITRTTIHDIYGVIYSCSLEHFNTKRAFDSDAIKASCCEFLRTRHHPDEFAGISIDSLVNKYYEIIFGLNDKYITEHLHQEYGKGQWKRERVVTHNDTFRFIVDSIQRETAILYKKAYKI